ncbi:MAG: hypothetical protein H7321_04545 [Bacteroidia bacterium]|nr:hypothetical protein [Bacteroidia bacterium]
MKFKLIAAAIIFTTLMSFSHTNDKGKIVKIRDFHLFANETGLMFAMPPGYTETYVKNNSELPYNLAIIDTLAGFEIRYSVFPLKKDVKAYNKCKKTNECKMSNPNEKYKTKAKAYALKLSGGNKVEMIQLAKDIVEKEFIAHTVSTTFIEFKSPFGKGYKYGQMIYLHKNNVADAVIIFMSNDKTTLATNMNKAYHSLVYRPDN